MLRQTRFWVLALGLHAVVFYSVAEGGAKLATAPLGELWAAPEPLTGGAVWSGDLGAAAAALALARAQAPWPMLGRGGVPLGQTATLERGRKIELDFSCRAGERMWVAVRVVGALPPGDGAGRPHTGYPLTMSVRGPALPETWGRPENDSLMLSWVPPKDGNYRVVITNKSKARVQFQYSGNR